jgi:tRNA(Ile2) C34 agmatinyltransferase TiaS
MNPLCPACTNEMSTASSRNMFRCEPCREIIQFFDIGTNAYDAEQRLKPSCPAGRLVETVRAA